VNWLTDDGLIGAQYNVYGGIQWTFGPAPQYKQDCSSRNNTQFQYSAAALIQGLAKLYNFVGTLLQHELAKKRTVTDVNSL
jgi:hypothetical protein